MWSNFLLRVGIIGNGFHSKRIQNILRKKKISFFLYKPNRPKYYDFEEFEKLKKCNVIFIISPNKTHLDYIKKLYNKRYIFCEKPQFPQKKKLSNLKKLNQIKFILTSTLDFSKFQKF